MRFGPALIVGGMFCTSCASAQLSFSDSSRLTDKTFVRESITAITDSGLWASVDVERPGMEGIRGAARNGRFNDAVTAWKIYREAHHGPSYVTRMDHLLIDTDMLTDTATFRAAMEKSPGERDTILARAEMILHNTIPIWGNTTVQFGERVDFNREIGRSGKYGFHYWIWSRPLIMAYVLTGDVKYITQFDQLFNAWYEQRNDITGGFPELNVVYYELGLGIRNRMFIESVLLPARSRTNQTRERILKTVLAAGRWLYELERWEGYRPGNWQIHGSYMLIQLALVFPEFREAAAWLDVGVRRMTEHLEKDFFSDGGHSERCPRNYTLATYLSFRNLSYLLAAHGVREDVRLRIQASMGRTIDWWIAMLAPTGEVPAINDSHRGVFPALVLSDGARAFGRPGAYSILNRLLGDSAAPDSGLPAFTSRHMPASGFSVMRTGWSPDALYMNINYGPFAGFHTHHDLLDFELYAYGKPMAVDAGIGLTYDDSLYVPWYQSTRAHNTVAVNDSNMRRDGVHGEDVCWGSTTLIDFFGAGHPGYERFGVYHRRRIAFVKPSYWFMLDELSCTRTGDTLSWYLHSPERLVPSGGGFVSASSPGISIIPVGQALSARTGRGWAASTTLRVPGKTEEIPWIRFDQTGTADSIGRFAIMLVPFRVSAPPPAARRAADRHYVVRTDSTTDHLYFSEGGYADGTIQTDGRFVCLRMDKDGKAAYTIIEGRSLTYKGRRVWNSLTPATAEGRLEP